MGAIQHVNDHTKKFLLHTQKRQFPLAGQIVIAIPSSGVSQAEALLSAAVGFARAKIRRKFKPFPVNHREPLAVSRVMRKRHSVSENQPAEPRVVFLQSSLEELVFGVCLNYSYLEVVGLADRSYGLLFGLVVAGNEEGCVGAGESLKSYWGRL